ncbi:TetR/AcrR family transcriptional regulator [Actinocorallia sp. API 0066]|uniref:TetR/AcrR family transcriptional regulator n=1 Tax=Actinocorallia sp. API 0066 TaxID=2896846 RepID=UPI001E4DC2A9|nr:TetR/AcrR family transcriptional regulator [Actinocorallia sp. API 0066]MCD0449287.1 TetR/AcrR family transcriptional regulator [Actinocorallia sp. API 0066]
MAQHAVRRRMPRDQRAAQLLDVAELLFTERGYASTTIEDIARVAGVTRPVVYEHHGDKEGIYLACVRRARRALEEEIRAVSSAVDDPKQKMTVGSDAYFRTLEDDARRWALLSGPAGLAADTLARELDVEHRQTVNVIAEIYRGYAAGADLLDLEALAHGVTGAAEQLARWWLAHPEVPRSKVVQHHIDLVWPRVRQVMGLRDAP